MQLAPIPLDVQLAQAFPHHFATWATQGRRKRYAWTDYLGRRVVQHIVRGNGRLIVNVPPQHGKSKFISEILPTWFLWRWPEKHVIITSYGAELAHRSGRECRNLIRDCSLPGLRLREDSTAAGRWNTEAGGGLIAAGFGGGVTGNPGHLIIVDDPFKSWKEAQSKRVRDDVRDWFTNTLYQRQQQDTTFVILSTRWHRDDLCGFLTRDHEDKWECVRLAALARAGDPMGRAVGEALCPDRYTKSKLQDIKRGTPEEVWNAVYDQHPDESSSSNVYPNFSSEAAPAGNIDKSLTIRPTLPLDCSFDFNRNPGMHIEVGQHDPLTGRSYVIHEIHGPRMALDASLTRLLELLHGFNGTRPKLLRVYGDASGNAEEMGDGKALYDKIRKRLAAAEIRYQLYIPHSNPPIVSRVVSVNDALRDTDGERRLFVHPRCERLVDDFQNLRVGPDGLPDKEDRKLSHASDAVGYWMCSIEGAKAWGGLRAGGTPILGR